MYLVTWTVPAWMRIHPDRREDVDTLSEARSLADRLRSEGMSNVRIVDMSRPWRWSPCGRFRMNYSGDIS